MENNSLTAAPRYDAAVADTRQYPLVAADHRDAVASANDHSTSDFVEVDEDRTYEFDLPQVERDPTVEIYPQTATPGEKADDIVQLAEPAPLSQEPAAAGAEPTVGAPAPVLAPS